jgi:capsular polysaccharide biosynthesis protein
VVALRVIAAVADQQLELLHAVQRLHTSDDLPATPAPETGQYRLRKDVRSPVVAGAGWRRTVIRKCAGGT